MSLEKDLAGMNGAVLYRQAAAGYLVEVVDDALVPTVRVTGGGFPAGVFPLEKLGLIYSDGDNKFYSEATGDEVRSSELNDQAVEAHLFGLHKAGEGFPAPLSAQDLCDCGHQRDEHAGKDGFGKCRGCECPSFREAE